MAQITVTRKRSPIATGTPSASRGNAERDKPCQVYGFSLPMPTRTEDEDEARRMAHVQLSLKEARELVEFWVLGMRSETADAMFAYRDEKARKRTVARVFRELAEELLVEADRVKTQPEGK